MEEREGVSFVGLIHGAVLHSAQPPWDPSSEDRTSWREIIFGRNFSRSGTLVTGFCFWPERAFRYTLWRRDCFCSELLIKLLFPHGHLSLFFSGFAAVFSLALVGYSSSSEDEEEKPGTPERLPVPASVLSMFPDPDDVLQNEACANHDGRIRSFKHQRGNWATYVYIPFQPEEEFSDLQEELISVLRKHDVIMNKMDEFHVSQSQTVILRHHWISLFVQSLRVRLGAMHRFLCVAHRFQVYTNTERTRTFLGLEVSVGKEHLLDVVTDVDQSLKEFNLQPFHQDPSFHVSVAWCVGDMAGKIQGRCLAELQTVLDQFEDSERLTRFFAKEIRCKAGNKMFCIALQ